MTSLDTAGARPAPSAYTRAKAPATDWSRVFSLREMGVFYALLLLVVIISFTTMYLGRANYLSALNVTNVMYQASLVGIMAVAMTISVACLSSSVGGRVHVAYAASKAGVVAFTRSTAPSAFAGELSSSHPAKILRNGRRRFLSRLAADLMSVAAEWARKDVSPYEGFRPPNCWPRGAETWYRSAHKKKGEKPDFLGVSRGGTRVPLSPP